MPEWEGKLNFFILVGESAWGGQGDPKGRLPFLDILSTCARM